MAAIVVPAARAQRQRPARHPAARRADAGAGEDQPARPDRDLPPPRRREGQDGPASARRGIQVDRHGRALVDVRAQVRPELEKKIKALGGIVVSTSHDLRFHRRLDAAADARAARRGPDGPRYRTGPIVTVAQRLQRLGRLGAALTAAAAATPSAAAATAAAVRDRRRRPFRRHRRRQSHRRVRCRTSAAASSASRARRRSSCRARSRSRTG